MSTQTLFAIAAAFLLAAGCDISQKKPETAAQASVLAIPPSQIGAIQSVRPSSSRNTSEAPVSDLPGTAGAGNRSIRLFGPGVSRKRQTRV